MADTRFHYIIIGEDGDVWGTNDREDALEMADESTVLQIDEDGSVDRITDSDGTVGTIAAL